MLTQPQSTFNLSDVEDAVAVRQVYDDTGENGSWALIPLGLFLFSYHFFSLSPISLGAFVIVGKAFSLFTGLNTVLCVYIL